MGNQKLKWTAEEEEALKAGVAKYGAGKWKNILVDSEFKDKLANRSNVDLKDKWRNMGGSIGQGSGANALTPKGKATATGVDIGQSSGANAVTSKGKATATGALPPKTQNSSSILVSKDNINDKPLQSPKGVKNEPKYNEMILEALSSIKDRDGSEFGVIMGFIEKKYEVPQSFRRSLSTKLRRLVMHGTVEKVQKRYKIKQASLGTRTPFPKQKVVRSKPIQQPRLNIPAEILEDAAKTAAHKIAEAEDKSFLAAEAVKECERISQMAEDADAMVIRLKEIFEQWEDRADNTNSKSSPDEFILMV